MGDIDETYQSDYDYGTTFEQQGGYGKSMIFGVDPDNRTVSTTDRSLTRWDNSGALPLDTPGVNQPTWVPGSNTRYEFTTDTGEQAIGGGAGWDWSTTPGRGLTAAEKLAADARNATVGANSRIGTGGSQGTGTKTSSPGGYSPAFNYPGAIPDFVPPVYKSPGAYTPPAWNERKVAAATQKAAFPYISEIRRAVRQAISRSGVSGSPIIQKYIMSGTMDAAGDKMGKAQEEAGKTGLAQYTAAYGRDLNAYNQNYQQMHDEAKMNFTTTLQAEQAKFQAKLAQYTTALKAYYTNPGLNYSGINTGAQVIPTSGYYNG
jgi:hypothetical protein